MPDKRDHYQIQPVPSLASPKRLGTYLVEAGLLTADQINVILNDQQATGMRFGEIVVARGWLKEQTIEWIMEQVIQPERRLRQREQGSRYKQALPEVVVPGVDALFSSIATNSETAVSPPAAPSSQRVATRRELPISKPLPSVNSADTDVNWVG